MPYKNPADQEECRKRWRLNHPVQTIEIRRRYKESIKVSKRCPDCNKKVDVRKDRKERCCPTCRIKLVVTKTLSDSNKNAHGIKLKVV